MPTRTLLAVTLLLLLLALGPAAAVNACAQELDAKWLAGKWWGIGRTNVSQADFQVEFKENGTFEGGSRSPYGHSDYRQGRWKIDGATILVEFVIDNPRAAVHGSKSSWTLERDGEELRGEGGLIPGAGRLDITLKRAK